MSIESEIERIEQNIANCYILLEEKGATMPVIQDVDHLAECILSIPTIIEENEAQ